MAFQSHFGIYDASTPGSARLGIKEFNHGSSAPPTPVARNAVPFAQTIAYNTPTWVNVSFSAGDSPFGAIVSVNAVHGTAVASGGSVLYTPTSGYAGGDSFTYVASNDAGAGTSAVGSLTVSSPAPIHTGGDTERLFPTVQNGRLFPTNKFRQFPST